MANTKGYMIRQRVIDDCLQSARGYSIAEMMARCNDALDNRGLRLITSMNTIRDDLNEISNTYNINISMQRYGRIKRYRYERRGFSIYKAPLTEKDLQILQQTLEGLDAFEGRPQFNWLEGVKRRIQSALAAVPQGVLPFVSFAENERLKGREYFQTLFDAIKNKHALCVRYQDFKHSNGFDYILHPYYLKEYNNRWFLFGQNELINTLTICALDRIESIQFANVPYAENNGRYDFETYFDNIIGVSKRLEGHEENILLWVSKDLYPYVETKPLHDSQSVVKASQDGTIIQINVIPNFELEQQLLSYSAGIVVLSPSSLRQNIEKRIVQTLENYNKFNSTEYI